MVSIYGIAYQLPCCEKNLNAVNPASTQTQVLKHKIEHIWNIFSIALKSHINPPVQKHILTEIIKADKAEAKSPNPFFAVH